MAAIEWFAQLCDSLSTNPGQATQLLTEFRESEVALESCKLFLQYPEINVNVLFQASLTLQYSFLKHWNSIQPVYKEELEQVILYLLQQKCGQENATSFALNKLMQLYALIWKHGWADSNEQQHSILFEKISLFLNQDNKQFIQCGLVFLKIIVEDFCNRGGSQVSLPVAIHNSIRVSFENDGLDQCLKLSLDWLSKCLAIVRQASFVITSPGSDLTGHQQTLALLRDALKLTNELLSWEFSAFTESGSSMLPSQSGSALFSAPSHNNSHGRDDNRFGGSVGRTMITLPASWTAYFVQSSLQQEVVQAYSAVKESLHQVVLVDLNFARDRNQTYQQTMFELRQLMANLAAINGKFADNTADKLQLASLLCNYMLPLVSQAYDGSITVGIEADTPAYSILTELEMTERQAFSSLFLTFIDNFQLANLASLPNFLDIVSLLAGMTRTTASSITQQYRSSGAGASSLSGSMIDGLDGAQGDTLTQLLEAWSILLTSPWMMSNYLLIDPMTNKPVLTEGSTQELVLTLTHEKIIVQQLKLLLLQSAEPLFSELYGLMICSVIHDLVSSEGEEEEEEEVEALYMTSVHDLMSGICTVGRSSFPSTYHFVTQSLTASLGQCQVALQQSNGVLSVDIIKNPTYILECRKVLESIRINILFMSHLLSDNYVTETNGNSQSNNSNSNVISSSETPLIPVFIIDACLLNGGTIYNIYQGLTQVCEVINFQLNLMSLASSSDSSGRTMSCSGQSHPLFSPLILQLSVQLLSLYLKRYINIDAGFYDSTLILVISDINTAHRNEQFNDLLSLCARAAYQCVYQLPHERDLIEATSELIDTVAVSLAYPRYASATILNLSSPRGKSSVQDISYFISLTDVSSLYTLLTTSEYLSLGFESIAELFKSISMLVVSASSKVLCEQVRAIYMIKYLIKYV